MYHQVKYQRAHPDGSSASRDSPLPHGGEQWVPSPMAGGNRCAAESRLPRTGCQNKVELRPNKPSKAAVPFLTHTTKAAVPQFLRTCLMALKKPPSQVHHPPVPSSGGQARVPKEGKASFVPQETCHGVRDSNPGLEQVKYFY